MISSLSDMNEEGKRNRGDLQVSVLHNINIKKSFIFLRKEILGEEQV